MTAGVVWLLIFAGGGSVRLDLCADPVDQLVTCERTISTGKRPKALAFSPNGNELWVTLLYGPPAVQVFDPDTGAVLGELALDGKGAVELVFNRDGTRLYVSQMQTDTLFELDPRERRVLRTIPTGGKWSKIVTLDPDECFAYVANWASDDVSEIDLTRGEVTRRLPTTRTPRGLWASPDGRLWIAGFGRGVLQQLDLPSGATRIVWSAGAAVRHLAVDEETGRLFFSDMGRNRIYALELGSGAVTEFARTNPAPSTIALSPDGELLLVVNRGTNGPRWPGPGSSWGSVLILDARDGTVLDAVVAGNQTTALAISPDGRRFAFSDFNDDRLRVYGLPPAAELRRSGGGRVTSHLPELRKRQPGARASAKTGGGLAHGSTP